jgi:radical SAM protein with 4Fe4S-binding SPASM domain
MPSIAHRPPEVSGIAASSEWDNDPWPESKLVPRVPGMQIHPMQVTWEMTRRCEWKGAPTRAAARAARDPHPFPTAEAFNLVEEVAAMHVPLLALTGGDPLLRPDLFPIIEFASGRSVRTSLTLLPTPLLDNSVIGELKACGLMRVSFWLHGSTPALHDSYWGVAGSFRRTSEIIGLCHEQQLPVQVNTILSRRNAHDFDLMVDLLTRLDVALWNCFFLVPADREHAEDMLDANGHEQIFGRISEASNRVHFQIKTTEGQHYQRYLLQERLRNSRRKLTEADVVSCPPRGVNDGKGAVFVDYKGEAFPSRYLPISGGNVTQEPLSRIFQESALFTSLRDSSKLKGKCGRCPARRLCGGSRARAYAMTGDMFAEEPCCAYEP